MIAVHNFMAFDSSSHNQADNVVCTLRTRLCLIRLSLSTTTLVCINDVLQSQCYYTVRTVDGEINLAVSQEGYFPVD